MASSSCQLISASHFSSSSSSPLWDVFLSFRGTDTRTNFISHLFDALNQAGIVTFKDNLEFRKGEEISSGLLSAICSSKISIVVISENYASSTWCLKELTKILECKRTNGQVVIPVFFYVGISSIRYHKRSFADTFKKHSKHHRSDTVKKWKSALVEIANMSGYHLKKDTDEESAVIHEIVAHVESQESTNVSDNKECLFGIESAVEEIYQKLKMESNAVRALVIWGMGGIGKTTTARAFYIKYSNKFDISCFTEDIKQEAQGGSTQLVLLEKLLNQLHRRKDYRVPDVESGIRRLTKIIRSNKALIVLDDLDESSYWKLLVRLCNSFSAGTRIMVTTRDVKMLYQLKVDIPEVDIYKLKELGQEESLKLFSYHAFRRTVPIENFTELSLGFVSYAGGLPLALKVLGSSLCGRTCVLFWKAKLKKVRQIPENDILKVLHLSYDELCDEQKAIFLDIVFFFAGMDKDEAVHIFESCHFFPDEGIPILVERCLLTIDIYNKFQMHKLIQGMGREVISEENKHGKCRYLSLSEVNACQALQNIEGADKIEVLIADLTMTTNRQVSVRIFEKLIKLRILQIIGGHNLKGNFKNSFHELRCIRWHYSPWTCIPSSFSPHKLVSLDMPFSKFEMLWNGTKSQVNLKTININYSKNLIETPNFKNAKMVEKLLLRGCTSLIKVHPTIGELTNLAHLDLSECSHLVELPDTIGQLTKLDCLDLSDCVELIRLPESMKQLINLSRLVMINCRKVKRLPEQLGHIKALKELNVRDTAIEQLPDSITQLRELITLDLRNCTKLKKLPEQLGDIKSLKKIYASNTAIEHLPDSITHMKELVLLNFYGCKKLKKLPEQFGNLEGLKSFDAGDSALEELPDSFECLINLVHLGLNKCENLVSLPDGIWKLKLLKEINLDICPKLESLPEQFGKLQCLEKLRVSFTAIEELPDSIGLLSTLKVLNWKDNERLRCLPNSIGNLTSLANLELGGFCGVDLPPAVENLKLGGLTLTCSLRFNLPMILSVTSLTRLFVMDIGKSFFPTELFSLSKLQNLRELRLCRCTSLGSSLPTLPEKLEVFWLYLHETLENLPDLTSFKQLTSLRLSRCFSLQSLSFLPPHLKNLSVSGCHGLREPPDLSLLKELEILWINCCRNLESVISLKENPLQVGQEKFFSFTSDLITTEVGEWFSHKSSGSSVSFKFPQISEENFFGIAVWFVYTIKNTAFDSCIRVITNETEGISNETVIHVENDAPGEVQSMVSCIPLKKISVGKKLEVSFQRSLYTPEGEVCAGEVNVMMCGAHVITKIIGQALN